jgi:uncharacterized protein
VACALLLLGMGVLIAKVVLDHAPFARMKRPVVSVPQFWGRELDAAAIADQVPTWQRIAVLASLSTERKLLDAAAKDLRALVEKVEQGVVGEAPAEADPVRARLAMTLAAAGRWADLDRLAPGNAAALRDTVKAAYGRGPLPAAEDRQRALASFVAAPFTAGHRDWWVDQLRGRLASRLGDAAAASQATGGITARGQRIVRRATWLAALYLVPLLGLALGLVALARRRRGERLLPGPLARGEVPLPFRGRYGLALLLRAATLGMLLSIPVAIVESWLPGEETGTLTLAASLPLLILLRRALAAQGRTVRETVGLAPLPTGPWARVTLMLIAAELALVVMASLIAAAADTGGSPTEALLESAALGSPATMLLGALEAVIWAPLFEEIAFRAVLYGSLRARFGVGVSALLSAAVFALLHGYSPLVLLPLGAGAMLSALVYERTRSLWPSILSHAFNNALVVAASWAVYR